MRDADLDELKSLALRIAAEAAAIHREGLLQAQTADAKSSPTDIVTEIDRDAERAIVEALRAARPRDGILAEEGTEIAGTSGVRWVIDPLDGTTNYYYRYPAFAVAIGVEVDGTRAVGVIHESSRDRVYAARLCGIATCDDHPIRVSDKRDLATALIATGFQPLPEVRRRQGELLVRVLPAVRDIRRSGSASFDLCTLATGQIDGFYEFGLSPWDIAAGAVIAEAAGATSSPCRAAISPRRSWSLPIPRLIDALVELVTR